MSLASRIARDWAARCFGNKHVNNYGIRALRTVEEAIELCQALGVPQETVVKAVDTVYSRPVGGVQQEIGGVLLTTAILCESLGEDYDELLERELRRVLAKSPEHFAKRNRDKLDLGLDHRLPITLSGDDALSEATVRAIAHPECDSGGELFDADEAS